MPPSHFQILTIDFTPRFERALKGLPENLRAHAKKAIQELQQTPPPAHLRVEKLHGYRNPSIYTIHMTPNHSHKISFELQGTHAIFRRVATHKKIDYQP